VQQSQWALEHAHEESPSERGIAALHGAHAAGLLRALHGWSVAVVVAVVVVVVAVVVVVVAVVGVVVVVAAAAVAVGADAALNQL
jgi:hypothetical protein